MIRSIVPCIWIAAVSGGCGWQPLAQPAIVRLYTPSVSVMDRPALKGVSEAYYRLHGDSVDMLVVWGAREFAPQHAFYLPVKNDVSGIGYQHVGEEFFDDSESFGSSGRLQGVIWMGTKWMDGDQKSSGPDDPLGILAQETAHRWGATVRFLPPAAKSPSDALSGTPFHWSFLLDTGGSPLGGNRWTDIGGGFFRADPVEAVSFSPIDMYLMGLLPADRVPPLRLLVDVEGRLSALGERVSRPLRVRADAIEVSIGQIIAAEGPRNSGFGASGLRQAWIAVGSITERDMSKLASMRRAWDAVFRHAARIDDGLLWDMTP